MKICEVTTLEMKPITTQQAIELLEDRGHYEQGTVNEIINKGETRILQTPNALYNFINNKR